MAKLIAGKARKILEEGTAHGKPLTKRAKRFMHFIAAGGRPTRLKRA